MTGNFDLTAYLYYNNEHNQPAIYSMCMGLNFVLRIG
jgi:hypothetical protein